MKFDSSNLGSMVRPAKNSPKGSFWERLRVASDFANVSCAPRDIAHELGIYPSAVTKYIEGKYPAKKNINKLAIRRKVRSEWLLSGQGDMVAEEALDEKVLEALRILQRLDESAKDRILISLRHELNSSIDLSTGKRRALTEEMIRQIESGHTKPQ